MTGVAARLAAVALALACAAAAPAKEPAALTRSNFVEAGDDIADMLDTSGLAFSTMVLGSMGMHEARTRYASFHPSRPQVFAQTVESPCPGGGSVKVSMLDADSSGDLSAADRFVTLFQSCMVEGSVISGRSEFVVTAHRFAGAVETTEIEFRFTDLGTSELRWSGPARVTLHTDLLRGTERYQVSYCDLAVTRGTRRLQWSFSLEMVRPPFGDQLARIDGTVTLGALRLSLQQDEPFAITSQGVPRAGQLSARDGLGGRLEVQAGRRHYTYRLFPAGGRGERPEAVSQSKPYAKG